MEERNRREEEEKLSRSEEEEIEKTLRSMTEDIEVPESLKPENVEQMLAGKRHAGKKRIRWKYAAVEICGGRCRGVYLSDRGDCRGIRGILYGQARQTVTRRFSDGRNRKNTAEG